MKTFSRLDRWMEWKSAGQRLQQLRVRKEKSRIKGNKSVLLSHEEFDFMWKSAKKQIESEKPDDL